jgi:hypothetical protein
MSQYFDNKQSFLEPAVQQYNSHMVMTNVMKPTKTKYINVDTKFREEDNFQSVSQHVDNAAYKPLASCTISLPERVNDVKSILARTAEIPMTMYNVSQYLNNNAFKVEYVIGSAVQTTKTFVVPDGYYTATTLVTAINTLLNPYATPEDVPESYPFTALTFSWNGDTRGHFTSSYGNFNLYFAADASGNARPTQFKQTLGWILGFRKSRYSITPSAKANAEETALLKSTKYLYIVVDEFAKGNQTSFLAPMNRSYLRKNILSKVILNETTFPQGSILPANMLNGYLMSDKREYNGKIDIQKLLVQLVDENGNLVDLNGADFSLTLQVEYE